MLSKNAEETLPQDLPRIRISDYGTSPTSVDAESQNETPPKFHFCRQKMKKKPSKTKFIHSREYQDLIKIEPKCFQDFARESFTNEILL